MLRTTDGPPDALASLELGGYVPLDVEWERGVFGPNCYWLTGEPGSGRVKAGFSPKDGRLQTFTAVRVRDVTVLDQDPAVDQGRITEGLPVCDPGIWIQTTRTGGTDGWKTAVIDQPGPVLAELGPTSFRIRFTETSTGWSRVLESGRIRCWITEADEFGAFEVLALTPAERASIIHYAERTAANRAMGVQRPPGV
jgi:hypothetical protein